MLCCIGAVENSHGRCMRDEYRIIIKQRFERMKVVLDLVFRFHEKLANKRRGVLVANEIVGTTSKTATMERLNLFVRIVQSNIVIVAHEIVAGDFDTLE